MIFQSYNLVEKLTVIENVLHGRLGYKSILSGVLGIYTEEEKKEAFEILEKVDMGKYAYQRCSNLSGGQKQRVGIARALMQKPILLLDDLFSEFDNNRRSHLAELIESYQSLITTTDLDHLSPSLQKTATIIELKENPKF